MYKVPETDLKAVVDARRTGRNDLKLYLEALGTLTISLTSTTPDNTSRLRMPDNNAGTQIVL